MIYIIALLAGIVGAAAGYALAATLAAGIALVTGMSNFEGAVGYFAAFGAGPIGGLAGLIGGVWFALRRFGRYRGAALALRMLGSAAALAALAAGGLGLLYLSQDTINPNGLPPQLLFEIRLPEGAPTPASSNLVAITLDTDKNQMPAWLATDAVRTEGGRAVITGGVELYYRTSRRVLVLKLPDQPARLFALKLKASPAATDRFGEWQRADGVDGASAGGSADGYELRYRVEDRSRGEMEAVDFEIRLPQGTVLPREADDVAIVIRTDTHEYDGKYLAYDWHRLDGAREVLIGGTGIPDPAAHPRVVLKLPGEPARVFTLELPAPAVFSPWRPPDAVEEPGQPPRPPHASETFELRYARRP